MHSVQLYHWDLICISESHLLAYLKNSYVDIPGYTLHRHDALGSVAKHGVCCYVKKELLVDNVASPIPNVLTIHLATFDVYVCIVYRAPSNSPEGNAALANFIAEFCLGREVILLGDFNLPTIDWTKCDPTARGSPTERMFLEVFSSSLGLTQWVTEPTFPRSGNILDLILTSEADRTGNVNVLDPLPGCDHCPTTFEYIFSGLTTARNNPQKPQRSWFRGNYDAISRRLAEVDWELEFAYLNPNQSFNVFTSCLAQLVHEFIPLKPSDRNGSRLPWATRPPRSLIHSRQDAWKTYKAVRHRLGRHAPEASATYSVFTVLNRQLRNFSVKSQAAYEAKLIDTCKDNPKLLHLHIRRKKVGCPSVGPLKHSSGQLIDDPQVMADKFVESFASVFTTGCSAPPAPYQRFDGSLDDVSFSVNDVLKVLSHLDGNSACGPDGIHPFSSRSVLPSWHTHCI